MIAALLSLLAGWFRYPWWSPAAIFVATVPLLFLRVSAINSWRSEVGIDAPALSTYGVADVALMAAASLALHYAAYGIGRGARRLLRRDLPET